MLPINKPFINLTINPLCARTLNNIKIVSLMDPKTFFSLPGAEQSLIVQMQLPTPIPPLCLVGTYFLKTSAFYIFPLSHPHFDGSDESYHLVKQMEILLQEPYYFQRVAYEERQDPSIEARPNQHIIPFEVGDDLLSTHPIPKTSCVVRNEQGAGAVSAMAPMKMYGSG